MNLHRAETVLPDRNVVIVVDPDPESRRVLRESVDTGAIHVREASTASEAVSQAVATGAHVVVTEMNLPDVTGLGLCRMLREHPQLEDVRVVLLTQYTSEVDRILSFEAGLDDLMVKPFSSRELGARVRAILRRRDRGAQATEDARAAAAGPSTTAPWVTPPTPIEARILDELADLGGRVVTRAELLARVWGESGARSDRVVDAHVKAIRTKLGPARDWVETVRGVGYRFRGPENA